MGAQSYDYNGGWQTFNVPKGVETLFLTLNGPGASGQKGGKVAGRLDVKDDWVLYFAIGGQGHSASGHKGGKGGWPGGGDGGAGVNSPGGDGGAGATVVRLGSPTGKILAVAAGAGGDSGDNGAGGEGGDGTGEGGHRGNAGGGATGSSTGGTPNQGGNGGTSSSGGRLRGGDGSNAVLGPAGDGGDTGGLNGPGGGGGGGGWRPGGGGQAGSTDWAPGGGGGGGSNNTGSLTGASSSRGNGSSGDGSALVEWSNPLPANRRPNTPSNVKPNDGARLKSDRVTIKAKVTDSDADDLIGLRVVYGKTSAMKDRKTIPANVNNVTDLQPTGKTTGIDITGLDLATHYYAHVYAVDSHGAQSLGYSSTNFYTDFPPDPPTLHTPSNGASFTGLGSTVFTWTAHDPDGEAQARAQLRWRRDEQGSPWNTKDIPNRLGSYTADPQVFDSNTFYIWQVRTRDGFGLWGQWCNPFRFYITGSRTAPKLRAPIDDEAVYVDDTTTFRWKFTDPDQGDSQAKADLRYRVKDTVDWTTRFGTTGTPGGDGSWDIAANTFAEGFTYEWAVRTYDVLGGGLTPSKWSQSQTFRGIITPGQDAYTGPIVTDAFKGSLGCGHNRVYLCSQGGHNLLGEIGPTMSVRWTRVRDDISKCNVSVKVKVGDSLAQLIRIMRSWQHELKVYRDTGSSGDSVWEGPITRITIGPDQTDIEAWDVMAWVYRRIQKQGYNDSHPNTRTVVDRSTRIIADALSRGDPNILRYLTRFDYADDALESRVKPPWSVTAWEDIDDMAAKGGLDYTVIGRRIILNDTHRPIGKLPQMDDSHFSSPPVLTEYGMSYATEFGVTNNSGVWGAAHYDHSATGRVEMLASAFGDTAAADTTTLTPAARAKLEETYTRQAQRNIGNRWPLPVVLRVPDNSTLDPTTPVDINFLVPGVWIPLQAKKLIRPFAQWQKLDSVTVTEIAEQGEQVQVVMSPAPGLGQDPDSDAAIAAEGSDGS